MKFEFPPLESGATGATGEGHAFASVEDWRSTGGDSSDTATLLAAIAAAKAEGGMHLYVPARFYSIEETLLIDESHIHLIGEGSGWHRSTIAATQDTPRTKFLWTGDADGTIVRFNTPAGGASRLGGGLQDIQLDGNNFLAARGLHLESWQRGDFSDLISYACSESQFRLSVVDYAITGNSAGICSNNTFMRCMATTVGESGEYLTSEAYGWHLTGSTAINNGNACFNTFYYCNARMSKGIGWKVENTDNNHFISVTAAAVNDDDVTGMEFGAAEQDSILGVYNARYNTVFGCQMKVHARAGQTGGASSGFNTIYSYSRANGTPLPVIEAGAGGSNDATLILHDSQGLIAAASMGLREGLANPFIMHGISHLFINEATGPLLLKDSSGAIREILEASAITTGVWTPVFSFVTPGNSVITHSVQNGRYMRVGQFIFLIMDIQFSTNAYTTAAGFAQISGLPVGATFIDGTMNASLANNVTFDAATTQIALTIPINSTLIRVRSNTSDSTSITQGISMFPPSKTDIAIRATGMYWTAAV